jgi:signal transduction histidine kinase
MGREPMTRATGMPSTARRARLQRAGRESGRGSLLLERIVAMAAEPAGADLDVLVEVIGRGLGARRCRLEVRSEGPGSVYSWPPGDSAPPGSLQVPVRHAGTTIGLLALDVGLAGRLSGARRRLIRDVGALLGPVLHAASARHEIAALIRNARTLAVAIGEQRTSAVIEQEDERRALERDLHDGAQHHLVALRMMVGLLENDLNNGDMPAARGRLERIATLLDVTENGLAETAAGILPRSLAASGLLAALTTEIRTPPAVQIEADATVRGRRYPLPAEVAVFFACLEAVNNVRKHAPDASVRIRLDHTYQGLSFSVRDDGPGFDPSRLDRSSGLRQLAERVTGAGGELRLHSAPGAGTTVEGFIPI